MADCADIGQGPRHLRWIARDGGSDHLLSCRAIDTRDQIGPVRFAILGRAAHSTYDANNYHHDKYPHDSFLSVIISVFQVDAAFTARRLSLTTDKWRSWSRLANYDVIDRRLFAFMLGYQPRYS
jgi:hypothetical protein